MLKKFLKISVIVILAAFLVAAGFIAYEYFRITETKDTHNLQAEIDKSSEKLIGEKQSVGLVVGLIQGDKWYMQGYGTVSKHSSKKPDSSSIFEIGSVTKVFTASITELLVEKGIMNWDDDISEYLSPEVKLPDDDKTTLKHLASHTSGFPAMPDALVNVMKDSCNPYKDLTYEEVYDYLNHCTDKKKADFSHFEYSNFGFGLLGIILERKTGKDFGTLAKEEICEPLDMNHTSIKIADRDTSNFVTGYNESGNETCYWDVPVLSGAGALRSNMSDMMKFLRANLFSSASLSNSFLKTQQKVADGIGYGWQIGYGSVMDFLIDHLFGIKEIIWKNGGTGGFSAYIGFDEEHKTGVVVMANQFSDATDQLGFTILIKARRISLK